MKYFIVNTTIKDGEYEYISQSPVMAVNEELARLEQEEQAREWTQDDYREYEVVVRKEITKREYEIVSKLIY